MTLKGGVLPLKTDVTTNAYPPPSPHTSTTHMISNKVPSGQNLAPIPRPQVGSRYKLCGRYIRTRYLIITALVILTLIVILIVVCFPRNIHYKIDVLGVFNKYDEKRYHVFVPVQIHSDHLFRADADEIKLRLWYLRSVDRRAQFIGQGTLENIMLPPRSSRHWLINTTLRSEFNQLITDPDICENGNATLAIKYTMEVKYSSSSTYAPPSTEGTIRFPCIPRKKYNTPVRFISTGGWFAWKASKKMVTKGVPALYKKSKKQLRRLKKQTSHSLPKKNPKKSEYTSSAIGNVGIRNNTVEVNIT